MGGQTANNKVFGRKLASSATCDVDNLFIYILCETTSNKHVPKIFLPQGGLHIGVSPNLGKFELHDGKKRVDRKGVIRRAKRGKYTNIIFQRVMLDRICNSCKVVVNMAVAILLRCKRQKCLLS